MTTVTSNLDVTNITSDSKDELAVLAEMACIIENCIEAIQKTTSTRVMICTVNTCVEHALKKGEQDG